MSDRSEFEKFVAIRKASTCLNRWEGDHQDPKLELTVNGWTVTDTTSRYNKTETPPTETATAAITLAIDTEIVRVRSIEAELTKELGVVRECLAKFSEILERR